jgi:hypothetical protein
LTSYCIYTRPFFYSIRVLKLSRRASYHQKWSCKCTMHVVPCPRHPLSSAFLFSFFFLFRCTECGGHGTVRYSFFLCRYYLYYTHPITSGAPTTSYLPHHLSTLTSRCFFGWSTVQRLHSAEAAQCRGCTRVSYTIYLALSVAWHHVGIIGGFGVWAERFASTDSQSYIYLIGRSWSFFSFSFS